MSPSVFALEQISSEKFDLRVSKQDKKQYAFKKVNKKYDTYLITIENKNKLPALISSDTEVILTDVSGISQNLKRSDVYQKTRSRDVGKSCAFALPSSFIAGGIIGFTFGLGTPVALGVLVIGCKPSENAQKINNEFAQNIYRGQKLPLRIEPEQIYQVRVFTPKKSNFEKITITNLSSESNFEKKFNLEIPLNTLEEI